MAKSYVIDIVDGTATKQITNGTYNVTGTSTGYDSSSISPTTAVVNDETNTFEFTMSASGTLTIHVSEDGSASGTAVAGAVFYRCDKAGNTYGNPITSDASGLAIFNNVPYASENAPTIYYKQTASDDSHNFDTKLYSTTLTSSIGTEEVINTPALTKTINLKDYNYSGLVIESAQITFTE